MDTSDPHNQSSSKAPELVEGKQAADASKEDPLHAYCSMLGIDANEIEKNGNSFQKQLTNDYYWHTAQYWFVASLANGLLWVQIVLGAALTALGATSAPGSKTAIIYLGATSTVISGLLTYFKSRNQPNRTRQLRQSLRAVRIAMDEAAAELHGSQDSQDGAAVARQKALSIFKMYDDALKTAAINYPDFWTTLKDLERKPSGSQGASEAQKDTQGSEKPAEGKGLEPGTNPVNKANRDQAPALERMTSQGQESTLAASSDPANSLTGPSKHPLDQSDAAPRLDAVEVGIDNGAKA